MVLVAARSADGSRPLGLPGSAARNTRIEVTGRVLGRSGSDSIARKPYKKGKLINFANFANRLKATPRQRWDIEDLSAPYGPVGLNFANLVNIFLCDLLSLAKNSQFPNRCFTRALRFVSISPSAGNVFQVNFGLREKATGWRYTAI